MLYQTGRMAAPDAGSRRKAMWGQVMCAAALELDEAHDLLRDLEELSVGHEPAELVGWSTSSFPRVSGLDMCA